jgi:hypothetical protein
VERVHHNKGEIMATSQNVVDKVREIAAAQPDYVYNTSGDSTMACYYTLNFDLTPGGCIIGRALRGVGISRNTLESYEGKAADEVVPYVVETSDDDNEWLRNVQMHQDAGYSWGTAVRRADGVWRRLRSYTLG